MGETSSLHKSDYANVTIVASCDNELRNQKTCPLNIVFDNVNYKVDKGKHVNAYNFLSPADSRSHGIKYTLIRAYRND